MTAIRKEAIEMLEKMPEDRVVYIWQILQGINGLYNNDDKRERKEAFDRLEQLRRKGTVIDEREELVSYRNEKYGE